MKRICNSMVLHHHSVNFSFAPRAFWCLLIGAAALMGCNYDSIKAPGLETENTEVLCSDGIDNDGNGQKDCDDPGCAWFAFCAAANRENTFQKCTDGNDNDHNGLTDCEEDDCVLFAECQKQLVENTPERCKDGKDNDSNGSADCADSNCQALDVCNGIQPENTEALCSDGQDNDNNDAADCNDANCMTLSICQTPENTEELCKDQKDNDNNGIKDCDEPGCKAFAHCQTSVVIGKCTGEPDTCTGKLRKYCDGEDWKTEYCTLGCDNGRCKNCEDINGPESCENDTHSYCPNPDDAPVTETCPYGCDGTTCAACILGQDVCGDDHLTIRHCIQDGSGKATVAEEACDTGLCLDNACVNVEDRNGNHMIDAWERQAPHIIGEKYLWTCNNDADCDGENFCDVFSVSNIFTQCSVRCIDDYECMDGFVCRQDGRCAADAFVTIWETKGNDEQITLNGSGSCSFDIDWGDGKTETITECSQLKHVYASAGRHTIRMYNGELEKYKFSAHSWYSSSNLIEVVSFGKVGINERAFRDAVNLSKLSSIDIPDPTCMTTDMTSMFEDASAFEGEGIERWDVSKVTNMETLFRGAKLFNRDLSYWDVSNVTNMKSMFSGATSFKSGVGDWDVSNVTNMSYMFYNASSFNENLNGNTWNVSNVTDMRYMFAGASNFDGNLGNWNVSNVTNMAHMFDGATDFRSGIGDSWDVSHVTDMEGMFRGASIFEDCSVSNWNVRYVRNMREMFRGAEKFKCDISGWDLRNVTDFYGMFMDAKSVDFDVCSLKFQKCDATGYFGKDVSYMFANASNLKRDLAGCDEMICKHDTAVGMFYNTPIVRSNYKSYEFLDLDKEEAFASSKYDCWILNRIYYYDGMLAYTSFCNSTCGKDNNISNLKSYFESENCTTSSYESKIDALCKCIQIPE